MEIINIINLGLNYQNLFGKIIISNNKENKLIEIIIKLLIKNKEIHNGKITY